MFSLDYTPWRSLRLKVVDVVQTRGNGRRSVRVSTNRKYDALACLLVENVLNVANATESVEGTTVMTGKEIKSNLAALPEKEGRGNNTCISSIEGACRL